MGKWQDLSGQRFGQLTAVKYIGDRKWICVCDCKNVRIVKQYLLCSGKVRSCGCEFDGIHSGDTFGRLTAVEKVRENGRTYWICRCSCGDTRKVLQYNLTRGNSKSCGCMAREQASERMTTHGMTGTKIHAMWRSIKERCSIPSNNSYKNYGGRGIKICDEWIGENGFQNFYNWAMSHGYRDDLTIDRIDVNGNYEPSNCRFATIKEQANNKRTNTFIEYGGLRLTIAQWEEMLGFHRGTISNRKRYGWSDIECIEGRKKH